MKNLRLILFFWISLSPLFAQVLPVDDKGKVAFYEVVKVDSIKAGTLYANAQHWLKKRGYTVSEADSVEGRLLASYEFPVYDKGYLSKKIHGKVGYQLHIDIKDNKYRYQFNDFVFAYYKEDRYYHQVRSGKIKPLEETTASGWQKLWERHRRDTQLNIESLIAQLKTVMVVLPQPTGIIEKQVKKEEW
ncbi:MAG: DUF4468 domain-containing protein [Bacteroidota bacterium]